jgi:hypothetical protein
VRLTAATAAPQAVPHLPARPIRRAGRPGTAASVALVVLVVLALVLLGGCSPDKGPSARVGSGVVTTTTTTEPLDPAVEDIVSGAGMTDLGRQLFLSADPSVEDPDTLAQSCAEVDVTAGPDGSHTFGCLIGGRIHVRSFADPEVRDLVYVVAAHELLHVVYGRLSRSERLALEPELQAARQGNPLLEERLEVYAAVAEDTPNEVHSLLGTEFADLGPVLEAHYNKYFDRDRVLQVFRVTLGDREDEIRALKASIEVMEAQLNDIQLELDRQDAVGDILGYNANVIRFNALVAEHNAAVRQVNALVDEDNRLTG